MIKSVTVKNYILIDEITLEFDKGFNVFTGETGAGKSIIIGAIDAALGAKVSRDVIKSGNGRAYIELEIELNKNFDKSILETAGFETDENILTISREISVSGNKYRINGVLAGADFIKEIREQLLDIHSQHQSYNYVQPKNHIILLDNYLSKEHNETLKIFKEKYLTLQKKQKELNEILNIIADSKQKQELAAFQAQEIEDAAITNVNEYEELEKELELLAGAEKLKELSGAAYEELSGGDGSITDKLGKVKSNISKLTGIDESLASLEEDFINAFETLKEISYQLRDYSENQENDNERMDEIGARLSLLDKMKRKYGGSLEAVLAAYERLSEELNTIENSEEKKAELEQEINVLQAELNALAAKISKTRKEAAAVLSEEVSKELLQLELPKARFGISIEPCIMNEKGTDKIEFLIAVNVSEELRPIAKTASGGEISRIMLALKTVFAHSDSTNTVIFDEIDTGISGKASQAAAEAVKKLSETHQIIMITHQAIIAAKADRHFYVNKMQEDTAKVSVKVLNDKERIEAAAMLAGGEINEQSLAFAEKLLSVHP